MVLFVWPYAYRLQYFASFNFQPERTIALSVGHSSAGDQFKNATFDPCECAQNEQTRAICAMQSIDLVSSETKPAISSE